MSNRFQQPDPVPTPAPEYSEAPEVYPPQQHTNSIPPQHTDTLSQQYTGSVSAMSPTPIQQKEYPFQPDSVGEMPHAPMNHEKTYPNQPQQFYAPQNPQQNGYANAVPLPLHAVQSAPCLVDCPGCRVRQMTRVEAVSGGTTHGWAAVLCFCCCLGCIPYLMSSLKDVEHSCGNCGMKLAVWHNSGRVEVLQPKK